MRKKLFFLNILIVVSLLSCVSQNEAIKGIDAKNIPVEDQADFMSDTMLFKSIKLVLLETVSNSMIKNVDEILFDENKYFIFDKFQNSIFIFDESGQFLYVINKTGGGPGEYIYITDICLDTDNKNLVVCSDPAKLIFYDYKGNFLREKSIPGIYTEISYMNNQIYLIGLDESTSSVSCSVYALDKNTYLRKCLMDPQLPESDLFVKGNYLTKTDRVLVTNRFDNHIYELDGQTVIPKYNIDFGDNNLPGNYKDEKVASQNLNEILRGNKYVYSILDMLENPDYLIFRTNQSGFYVYSKNKDQLMKYGSVKDSRYNFFYTNLIFVENSRNSISFLLSSNYITRFRSTMKTNNVRLADDSLNFLEKIENDSNPILVVCEFN